ncbi:hypothetical protein L208DRAFT_1381812 [Tricholoma matsutake]|nr:hypothetical protein L208DRAFT_1381812 [Tricholoma matsutake 945]
MAAVQERLLANGESKGILYMTLFAKCRSSADIPDPMLHHTASPAVIQTNAMIPVTPHIPTVLSGNTSALSANTNVQAHVLKFQRQSAGFFSHQPLLFLQYHKSKTLRGDAGGLKLQVYMLLSNYDPKLLGLCNPCPELADVYLHTNTLSSQDQWWVCQNDGTWKNITVEHLAGTNILHPMSLKPVVLSKW